LNLQSSDYKAGVLTSWPPSLGNVLTFRTNAGDRKQQRNEAGSLIIIVSHEQRLTSELVLCNQFQSLVKVFFKSSILFVQKKIVSTFG